MSAQSLDWLTARPIAHRGLHDFSRGLVENSVGAARAASAAGYGVECDVQITRDGDLVVFHDDTLERLTGAQGRVADVDSWALTAIKLKGVGETIPTFGAFLEAIDARTPLVVELKSDFTGNVSTAKRAAEILSRYRGPVCMESFDPELISYLRAHAAELGVAHIPLGIVGEAAYVDLDWAMLAPRQRNEMTHFLHYPATRPDFLSWSASDLPHAIPFLMREALGIPVTVWTVRSDAQAQSVRQWADQIVFEGFAPA